MLRVLFIALYFCVGAIGVDRLFYFFGGDLHLTLLCVLELLALGGVFVISCGLGTFTANKIQKRSWLDREEKQEEGEEKGE